MAIVYDGELICMENKDIGKNGIFYEDKIISIGKKSFKNHKRLKECNLPAVEEIYKEAFMGCVNLTKVIMPHLTYIAERAFVGCKSLPRPEAKIRKEIYEDALSYSEWNHEKLFDCVDTAIRDAIIKYKQPFSIDTCFPRYSADIIITHFNLTTNMDIFLQNNKQARRDFLKWIYEDFNEEE